MIFLLFIFYSLHLLEKRILILKKIKCDLRTFIKWLEAQK
jgi:hypothetical protein